jgi:hypothetical protein
MDEAGSKLKLVNKKQSRAKKLGATGSAGAGVKTLRDAADKAVGENSVRITKSLIESTIAGNVPMAKLLLDLVNAQPEMANAVKHRRRRSVATQLAAEPKWVGKQSNAIAMVRGN